jgi:SlyX protein
MTRELEARIEKLEEHVAHQEQVIDELNQTVMRQWAEMEKLTRRLNAAVLRLQAVEERPQGSTQAEPPPPHY